MAPSTVAGIPSRTKSQRQPAKPNHAWLRIQPATGEPITNESGIAPMKLLVALARSSRMNQWLK